MTKKRKRKGRSLNDRFERRKTAKDPCGCCGGILGMAHELAPIRSNHVGQTGDELRHILVCAECARHPIEHRTNCANELERIFAYEVHETRGILRFR